MNYKDLIEREYRLRYNQPFSELKPTLLAFIEECMAAVEADGPFAQKVREMRLNQTKFFQHRSKNYLDKSKELEKEVDLFLAPKKPKVQQGDSFNPLKFNPHGTRFKSPSALLPADYGKRKEL